MYLVDMVDHLVQGLDFRIGKTRRLAERCHAGAERRPCREYGEETKDGKRGREGGGAAGGLAGSSKQEKGRATIESVTMRPRDLQRLHI